MRNSFLLEPGRVECDVMRLGPASVLLAARQGSGSVRRAVLTIFIDFAVGYLASVDGPSYLHVPGSPAFVDAQSHLSTL